MCFLEIMMELEEREIWAPAPLCGLLKLSHLEAHNAPNNPLPSISMVFFHSFQQELGRNSLSYLTAT